MLRWSFFIGLLWMIAGCDSADFNVLDNRIVVDLTLYANEPVPWARVSEVAPTDQPNAFTDLAVTNARVILRTSSTELLFEHSPLLPGVYTYQGEEHIVQAGATYTIEITVPGLSSPITGTTNVPTSVEIVSASRESGTYLSDQQLVLIVTPGRGSNQNQSNFTLATEALDVDSSVAVPLVLGSIEDDDETTLEDFRITASPIITEGNFVKFLDQTIELIYPWIGVSFFGPNIIYVNAIDDNLTNFIRSAEQQQGGDGSFGPGVIPNVVPTLSGAHGLFGSVARDSVRFTVFPPE